MDNPQQHSASETPARASGAAAGLFTLTAAFLAGLIRLVPHAPNLTAVGALGLFGGARLRFRHAVILPLAVMVMSDLALWPISGFHPWYSVLHPSRLWVYASLTIYVLIGWALAQTNSAMRIGLGLLLGSIQFFLITNFSTWLVDRVLYSRDFLGLMECYVAGLPFYSPDNPIGYFGWTLLGDLGFGAVLFGAYAWLAKVAPAGQPAPVAADPNG